MEKINLDRKVGVETSREMSAMARWAARNLWWWMLWLMRRPWMRKLQGFAMNRGDRSRRERFRTSLVKQNRWARRYGLRMLVVAMNLFFASALVTYSYVAVLKLYESGALTAPSRR